jgi:hypothetical protein
MYKYLYVHILNVLKVIYIYIYVCLNNKMSIRKKTLSRVSLSIQQSFVFLARHVALGSTYVSSRVGMMYVGDLKYRPIRPSHFHPLNPC